MEESQAHCSFELVQEERHTFGGAAFFDQKALLKWNFLCRECYVKIVPLVINSIRSMHMVEKLLNQHAREIVSMIKPEEIPILVVTGDPMTLGLMKTVPENFKSSFRTSAGTTSSSSKASKMATIDAPA